MIFDPEVYTEAMSKLDVNFFKPFIDGTLLTMRVQCRLECKPGHPFYKGKGPEVEAEIIAVIGLASDSFKGTIALLLPKTVFLALMGNMLGETYTEITNELESGAAELLNIIFGHAKTNLADQGYKIAMAIPSIIRGKGISTHHISKEQTIVIPFICPQGNFHIEISAEG